MKEYIKPLAEIVEFQPKDNIMGDLPLDPSTDTSAEGPDIF